MLHDRVAPVNDGRDDLLIPEEKTASASVRVLLWPVLAWEQFRMGARLLGTAITVVRAAIIMGTIQLRSMAPIKARIPSQKLSWISSISSIGEVA
jgi:hypothetical protein